MKQIIKESPKLIPSSNFGLEKEEKNKLILQRLQRKKEVIDNFGGYDIYKSGNSYFAVKDGWIAYLMIAKNDKIKRLRMPYATQVLVWRLFGKVLAPGLAAHVFWKHLFPIHNIVMSDSQQTKEGQRFWGYQVGYALENKYFVYVVNVRTGETKRVSDPYEVFNDEVYGTSDYFKLIRIVISKYPLFEEEKG